MEFTVTAKVKVSIIADTRQEADSEALSYLQSIMSMVEVEILDIQEEPGTEYQQQTCKAHSQEFEGCCPRCAAEATSRLSRPN